MDDLFHLDARLNEQQRLIQTSVRKMVDEKINPHLTACYEQGKFPKEFIEEVAKLGLLGITLPEEYGGAGASAIEYGVCCQELERGDSGLRSFVSVQSSLCMFPIYQFGSELQKKKWLPLMAKGKAIGCFGLTEPDVGSDPGNMQTTAKAVDGGWLLNGSKMWITNAPIADLAIVWAKTDLGVRGFIVEKEFPGFTRNRIHNKLSLRASETGELVFQDCFVPAENLLPGSDSGLKAPLACLTQARYGITWGVLGAAMACFDLTLAYAKERQQFNRPIASFQLIQKELVDMYNELVKAQLLCWQLGELKQAGQLYPVMVSMVKMNNCREALTIARNCRNILGANGISLEYQVIRHMTNLESVFTYEGTDNIHHLVVGRYLTGISAFAN